VYTERISSVLLYGSANSIAFERECDFPHQDIDASVECVGLIARKRRMKSLFDDFGIKVPVTGLQVRPFARFSTLSCAQVPLGHELHTID
jgi:hypothetical protein